jgi:uncharacterized protein YceK
MIRIFIALLFGALLSGCASLLTNSAYPVAIESAPGGAQYVIRNRYGIEVKRGMTPEIVILESGAGYYRKAYYTVAFHKPGYRDQLYALPSNFNEWYIANILNIVGFFFDAATGAMWTLPQQINALLVPDNQGLASVPPYPAANP